MFKSIGKTLASRQESLEQNTRIEQKVQRAVRGFLQENYPEVIPFVSIGYKEDARLVSIITMKKSITSELLLHTKDIRAQLSAEHIFVDKIIVC